MNISFNGLSGRNQEAASLFYKELQDQEYQQRKEDIEDVIVGAGLFLKQNSNNELRPSKLCNQCRNTTSASQLSRRGH